MSPRFTGLTALLAGLLGCGGATPARTDGGAESALTDATASEFGAPPDVTTPPPYDLWYVIDTLTIDDPAQVAATGSHGFDLDGLYSAASGDPQGPGCGKPDSFSTLDLDQNCAAVDDAGRCSGDAGASVRYDPATMAQVGGRGGVDNQLPDLLSLLGQLQSGDSAALLQRAVSQSRLVWLVRVTAQRSLANEPGVEVRVYTGYPTFGDGCDAVTPGRRYQVAATSLLNGSLDSARLSADARIVGGRLFAQLSGSLPLSLPASPLDGGIPLALRDPQLRVDLTGTTADRVGTRGNLGGAASAQAILDSLPPCTGMPNCRPVKENLVSNLVDLRNPVCYTRMNAMLTALGEVGIGLGFTLVAAEVDTSAPAAAQSPGTCGYAP